MEKNLNKELSQIQKKADSIQEKDFGPVITDQVNLIKELEKKINETQNAAQKAKKEAKELSITKKKLKKPKTWFKDNKKEAIENIQKSEKNTANAVAMIAENQNLLFEYQKQITNATKFLYVLGARSLSANRRVMDQVLHEIEGCSDEETAALVEEELNKVLDELREQQDILRKQEQLESKAKTNHDDIKKLKNIHEKQNDKINLLFESLSEKEKIDEEQTQRLNEKDLIDKKQDQDIKNLISFRKQKDTIDKKQFEEIELVKKSIKKLFIISIILSTGAIILGIINLMLELF